MNQIRNIRMVRIDDDFKGEDMAVVPYLDHVRFEQPDGGRHAISGLRDALHFWKNFDRTAPVDIVVSDVRFVDPKSFIASICERSDDYTPNGLAYLLPFAAVARVAGRPFAVGMHTGDAGHWEDIHERDTHSDRSMSLVAAQSIAQLAAIRGHATPSTLAQCWRYLGDQTHSPTGFRDGIKQALRDYRRQAVTTRMMPDSWRELGIWRESMRDRVSSGETITFEQLDDIGCPFILGDGSPECISIRSMFADIELYDRDFHVGATPLSGASFDPYAKPIAADMFLGEDGGPLFGVLIDHWRQTADLYRDATEVLAAFPIDAVSSISLNAAKKKHRWHDSAVALAILLADSEMELARSVEWRRAYLSARWDATKDEFTADYDKQTLHDTVLRLSKFLPRSGTISRDELSDILDDLTIEFDTVGLKRVIDCLISLGRLSRAPRSSVFAAWNVGVENRVPTCPATMPGNVADQLQEEDRLAGNSDRRLLARFGFKPANGMNPIDRCLMKMAKRQTEDEGAAYLARFRDGAGEPWVKELCRTFARGIADNEAEWPRSIKLG